MRKDFKYPFRVITRKEEKEFVEGLNYSLGFIVGIILFFPIFLVLEILSRVFLVVVKNMSPKGIIFVSTLFVSSIITATLIFLIKLFS
jgi:hypothetical protein